MPYIPDDDPGDDPNNWSECPTCGGTGFSDEDAFPCEDCGGNGGIEADAPAPQSPPMEEKESLERAIAERRGGKV